MRLSQKCVECFKDCFSITVCFLSTGELFGVDYLPSQTEKPLKGTA